jgi:hypothetical protein
MLLCALIIHCKDSNTLVSLGIIDNTCLLTKIHLDHCIDYLRQVIMCHGDLTPITFEWNIELDTYLAHHSTTHECRDFGEIFEWAKGRNNTGIVVDGNHENRKLSSPEQFD